MRALAAVLFASALLAAADEARACSPLYGSPEPPFRMMTQYQVLWAFEKERPRLTREWAASLPKAYESLMRDSDHVGLMRARSFSRTRLQFSPNSAATEEQKSVYTQEIDEIWRYGAYSFDLVLVRKGAPPASAEITSTTTFFALPFAELDAMGSGGGRAPCPNFVSFNAHRLYLFGWREGAPTPFAVISLDSSSAKKLFGKTAPGLIPR